MANTIQVIPYSGNPAAPYAVAGTTRTFAGWGVADTVRGRYGSADHESCTLELPGTANVASIFPYRALVKVIRNGKRVFTGVVPKSPVHRKSGQSDRQVVAIAGPWWFLDNLPFQQELDVVLAVDGNGVPTFQQIFQTHFTLNLPLTTNVIPSGVINSITYTPTLLPSDQQIAAVLDQAKTNGAYLDYSLADLDSLPVEPADVLNISCAEAIRRQGQDYHTVCWFDHTQDPPKLHFKRISNLPAINRQKGGGGPVVSFDLNRCEDLAVPFVQIEFEQPYSIGSLQGIGVQTYTYPNNPIPADKLKALITTIPLKGISIAVHSKFIQTAAIAPGSLDWWKARKPEMNPAENPNAGNEYYNLALIPGTALRNLDPNAYPNQIVGGGWATWMGGNPMSRDDVLAQFSYERRSSITRPGSKINAHTVHARCDCTNLNYPAGAEVTVNTVASAGEWFAALATIPQLVYEDLNSPVYEGTIQLIEPAWSGTNMMGNAINVTGALAEFAAMNAPIQSIEWEIRTGAVHYTVAVGLPNRVTPQQFKTRMAAARWRYVTAISWTNGGNSVTIVHPVQDGQDNTSQGQPDQATQVLTATEPVSGNTQTIEHDSTTGQIVYKEYGPPAGGGTLITTATFPRYFTGNGSPNYSGSGTPTLPAIAGYKLYDRYTDTTANADYICTFAGTNATSTWAQISGGGGGGNVWL